MDDISDFMERIRHLERRGRNAARSFAQAVSAGDRDALSEAIDEVEATGQWAAAMRACGRLVSVPSEMQDWAVRWWTKNGDSIRSDVTDDRSLMSGLRVLLPKYAGSALTLYRGDSAWNRRRRSYGLSWTSEIDVARKFAQGIWSTFEGGSVLLKTDAPAEAIVCSPAELGYFKGEAEYLVDRRRLATVTVIERFVQKND